MPGALLARNAVMFETPALTAQAGNHLLNWVVPEVRFAADGAMPNATRAENTIKFEAYLKTRDLAQNRMSTFAIDKAMMAVARAELARLPVGAYLEAWAMGMVTNLAAPPLISDARMRALPKPSFTETAGATFSDRIMTFLFAGKGLYQTLVLAGLAFMAMAGILELWGFVRLLAGWPWIGALAAGLVLYLLLVTGPVAAPKYRLAIEPVLIVLAALALTDFARRLGRRRI